MIAYQYKIKYWCLANISQILYCKEVKHKNCNACHM